MGGWNFVCLIRGVMGGRAGRGGIKMIPENGVLFGLTSCNSIPNAMLRVR
jgi:hypothetical protein